MVAVSAAAAASVAVAAPMFGSPLIGRSRSVVAAGVTLIMGAQRFAASAGLLADVSDAHRHTLGALKWASGDLSTAPFTCPHSDPDDYAPPLPPLWAMQPPAAPPSPEGTCGLLFWMLVGLAIVVFTTLALHLLVHNLWKRKVNRKRAADRYQSAALTSIPLGSRTDPDLSAAEHVAQHVARASPRVARAADDGDRFPAASRRSTSGGVVSKRLPEGQARFRPYPSAFVFPGLQLVIISLFLTGLVQQAFFILSSADGTFCVTNFCPCYVLAYIAVAIAIAYVLLAVALLAIFNCSHRSQTWRPILPVPTPSLVDDPLYRALSKLRSRMHWHDPVVMRWRGTFVRPEAGIVEPARTDRLLRRPYSLWRGNASDSVDAHGFSLMARARGTTSASASFEVSILTAQIAVGALNGLGAGLGPSAGDAAILAQMLAILWIQALTSLWLLCTSPTADRCIAMVIGTQFALEGAQTMLLLIHRYCTYACRGTARIHVEVLHVCMLRCCTYA